MYSVGNGPMAEGPDANIMITQTMNGQELPRWQLDNFSVTLGRPYNFMFVLVPKQNGAAMP